MSYLLVLCFLDTEEALLFFFPVEEKLSLRTPVLDDKNSVQSFQDFQAKRPGSFVENSYQGRSLPLPPFQASPQPCTDKTSSPQAGKHLEVNLHVSMSCFL